jgi:hypothetical protein
MGHILRRNCLINHFIEGKIEGRVEMTGRRERRRREQLDDLKDQQTSGYFKFKDEALDRTLWRTRSGRGYWPGVKQITEWMMNGLLTACCERGNKRFVSCKNNFLTSWATANFSNRISLQGFGHVTCHQFICGIEVHLVLVALHKSKHRF